MSDRNVASAYGEIHQLESARLNGMDLIILAFFNVGALVLFTTIWSLDYMPHYLQNLMTYLFFSFSSGACLALLAWIVPHKVLPGLYRQQKTIATFYTENMQDKEQAETRLRKSAKSWYRLKCQLGSASFGLFVLSMMAFVYQSWRHGLG